MSHAVAVPDPVYKAISREAEQRDVPRGVVVEDWMQKAERLDVLNQDNDEMGARQGDD